MLTRLPVILGAAVVAVALALPAFANPHVIATRTSGPRAGALYLSQGLLPGHRYQLHVTGQGHVKILAFGTESLTYLSRGRLSTYDKQVNFKGTTPYTYSLTQPQGFKALGWIFAMQVSQAQRKQITLKVLDMGTHG